MRELTDIEARVVAILLSLGEEPERVRLDHSGMPRSTYHAARKRAYTEGWVYDRYLPDPRSVGWTWVSFLLASPFADRSPLLLERWVRYPGSTVLWRGPQWDFAVLFHRDQSGPSRLRERLAPPDLAPLVRHVSVEVDPQTVPVYFDYAGLWSHIAGDSGVLRYPRPLAERPGPVAPLSGSLARSLAELVHLPFGIGPVPREGHRLGPLGLPRSQRRLLAQRAVVHRTLIDPRHLPPYRGRAGDEIVLITGAIRDPQIFPKLLPDLWRDCRVYPFLCATDRSQVLLAGLSQAGRGSTADGFPRRPVLATLSESLQDIEVRRQPVSSLEVVLDHRYDRLVASSPP